MMNARVAMNEEMMAQVNGGELFPEKDQDGELLTPERKALRQAIRKDVRDRAIDQAFDILKSVKDIFDIFD